MRNEYEKIPTINRAQLIDDALNLARAELLDYTTALDITSYLVNETDYLPWKTTFNAMNYIDNVLVMFEGYDKFRIFVQNLLDKVYKEVGFRDDPMDEQLTVLTRVDVLKWACRFGHEDCVNNAIEQFNDWRKKTDPSLNNPISPNLKSIVYCTAVKMGGEKEWEFIWQRYKESNVGSEKDLLLQALGCTREIWLLSRYLDWALTENSGIRKQDVVQVFSSVANNVIGQSLAFNYFRTNWNKLTN